ncbi:MAG: aminodeoxychorismate/anthranilate synthase component II [Acholeplasmatales bacterium]|nr:aminodeoxychorismate/anthranilate synthase component II [Acholeplasmatales bacterium]
MILLIDNYDSFSFNLYQYIGSINPDIKVIKNDEMTVDEIIKLNPSHIVVSPGPGRPKDAGIIEDVIRNIHNIPILGVCLGHQAICEVFGLEINNAVRISHGKRDNVKIDNTSKIFKGLKDNINVARYHSLIGRGKSNDLKIISVNKDKEIMAVEHIKYPIYGLQFHPESILTDDGMTILKNFFEIERI